MPTPLAASGKKKVDRSALIECFPDRLAGEGEEALMSTTLLIVQTLNGLQLGVLLFLIAAGLTLVFGVMDFINLAHGVQYMLGAYLAVMFYGLTGNFFIALVLA